MTIATRIEPLVPDDVSLSERATLLLKASSKLGGHTHPTTIRAVSELLRTVNCYYSNLIEGHDTHPVDIDRAMRGDYAGDPDARDLQIEARAHIDVERLIEDRLNAEPTINPCASAFVRWVHREFYERMPAELRIVRNPDATREEVVEPGELRAFDVRVGRHIAPSPDEIAAALSRYAEVYTPERYSAAEGFALAGAMHHRLLWIHPFGDGNGRVTRLVTNAWLRRVGVGSLGLWSTSRGLARRRDEYKSALAAADAPRWNDVDGRGNLSMRGLNAFCAYFLEVCADQISYMSTLLDVDGFADRMLAYGKAREARIFSDPNARASGSRGRPRVWRSEATRLLYDLVYRGEVARGEIVGRTGLEPRTARRLVEALTLEGFMTSESRRAPLRLAIPSHAAAYLFPDLYAPIRTPPRSI